MSRSRAACRRHPLWDRLGGGSCLIWRQPWKSGATIAAPSLPLHGVWCWPGTRNSRSPFWKGAVHIDDVATAVIPSLDLLSRRQLDQQLVLTLDSAYEYTDADLDHWDAEGPGSTFRKYYPEYHDLALSYGLDPALKPTKLDISETVRWLGYKPGYSLANLLSELAAFGDGGPPHFTGN